MSVAVTVDELKRTVRIAISMCKAYFRRHHPIRDTYETLLASVKDFLSTNKKLKIAKYRVNHLRYRMHQMETLMEENNPTARLSGSSLNVMR